MSALPKRPGLLTAAQLQLSSAHKRRLSRTLQSLASSQLSQSLQPPLSPPSSSSPSPGAQQAGPYPPAPYPALLALAGGPHTSTHPQPPPARTHRPPKKGSTTLFPSPTPSAPPAPSAPPPRERERTALWTDASNQETKEREEREGGRRWGFHAAAGGLPKSGGACVTRGGGVVQVGEDCYFVLPDSMGVSDGVGGLKGPRCNPGLFALSLITHASTLMSPSSSSGGASTPSSVLSQSPSTTSSTSPSPNSSTTSSASASSRHPPADSTTRTPLDPHPALLTANALTLSAFALEGLHGSATCTLARLYPEEGALRVAHVGDCELWCVRREPFPISASAAAGSAAGAQVEGEKAATASDSSSEELQMTEGAAREGRTGGKLKVVFRTPAMQKSFNHPAQLSTPIPGRSPASSPSPSASNSPNPSSSNSPNPSGSTNPLASSSPHPDSHAHSRSHKSNAHHSPSAAQMPKPEILTYTLPVQPRDIILLSSDGVTDNLWEDEILEELEGLSLSLSLSLSSPSASSASASAGSSTTAAAGGGMSSLGQAAAAHAAFAGPGAGTSGTGGKREGKSVQEVCDAIVDRAKSVALARRAPQSNGKGSAAEPDFPPSSSSASGPEGGTAEGRGSAVEHAQRERARAVVEAAKETGEVDRPEVRALRQKLEKEDAKLEAQPASSSPSPSAGVAQARESSKQEESEMPMKRGKEGRGTPFEMRAREAGRNWRGGKNDDISVVLAVVEEFGERAVPLV